MPRLPEIKINVRNLAFGGDGVGEVVEQSDGQSDLLGITAFVPYSVSGEKVSARIIQHKERYLKTELLAVEQPAPERIEPSCRYFTVCGGCELQHMSYPAQLEAKRKMIEGALRAAQLPGAIANMVREVVPGSPYGYRRRVSLHIDGNGNVGFYRENSRTVVALSSCDIAASGIQQALLNVQELGAALKGKISSLQLEQDEQGVIAVCVAPYALSAAEAKQILESARKHFANVAVFAAGKEVTGCGRKILEQPLNDLGNLMLRVPAGSFSQVNWEINRKLIKRVVELANIKPEAVVYDLYAGAGNFSIPLARAGASVVAVESDSQLTGFGKENAKRLGFGRKIEFVESSVEAFLKSRDRKLKADLVVADPPRSGLGGLIPQLGFSRKLLLISCHLPSFVRDLKSLVERGWKPVTIEPFDMFAQTSYVEILAELEQGQS